MIHICYIKRVFVTYMNHFLFCVIDCADHCVYIGIGTINCVFGGRVVVGSELYKKPMPTPSIK